MIMTPSLKERFRGALLGLAAGDAVGTTVEFRPRGSFPPVTDMVGGGPFGLRPGEFAMSGQYGAEWETPSATLATFRPRSAHVAF